MAETSRLAQALDKGLADIPADGRILFLHPPGSAGLAGLNPQRIVAVQPMRPDHDALARRGLATRPLPDDDGPFAAAVVWLPRSRALARALIAAAVSMTDGTVFVDGAKTDGVEAALKDVRARTELDGRFAKAHGKLFWFRGGRRDWSDWAARSRRVDGFETRPGVFSADGVDPASEMLAAHLPATLGAHVVDLGAGWGYLSARALDLAGPDRIDLVEADYTALDCARANVRDPRARFHWADARAWSPDAPPDAVIMNPPFHAGRSADPGLGRAFVENAARILAPAGVLWMVANRHLPYEATLESGFSRVEAIGGDRRFKVLRAERPSRRRR